MESRDKSKDLQTAAGLDEASIIKVKVKADSLVDVNQKLSKLNLSKDDHYLVNITGGTKLMSIGVHAFFSQFDSEMFYINISKHTYRCVFPVVKEKKLKYKLGLVEYLTGYGLSVDETIDINTLVRAPALTRSFLKTFLNFSELDRTMMSALQANNKKKKLRLDSAEAAILQKRWGFIPEQANELQKQEIRYLTGEWFEEYVYNWMKSYLRLADSQIGKGVKIWRGSVDNEFDVLFYHNHVLSVIECKTALWDSRAGRNFLGDSLYKLDSLQKKFGLRVVPYLFTLAERGDLSFQIREHHVKRAQEMGVEIVDRSVIVSAEKRTALMKKIKG